MRIAQRSAFHIGRKTPVAGFEKVIVL